MELKKKIDYENGQINKVDILSNNNSSITLIAFDKGTEIDTHPAPCDVMLLVVDGTAHIILEGNDMILKEGEFLTMREGVQHSVKADKKFKLLLTKLGK